MHRGNRRRGDGIALFLLITELMRNYQYLPIVTLSTVIGQILIYLKILPFIPWITESNVCVSLYKVLSEKDYSKIFISQIEHADDWHLYYNMISFMNKSKSLELKFGTIKYILLLLLFTIATGCTYLGLNYCLLEWTHDESYFYRCAVGFSGVIFALKVLTTHYWPNNNSRTFHMMGLPLFSTGSINSKYMVWIELGVISLISPNASFVGHLAGILVGLAYVYGPLEWILDFVYGIVATILGMERFTPRPQFTQTSRTTGFRRSSFSYPRDNVNTRSSTGYSSNSDMDMTEEEQIRRATEESLRDLRGGERHYGFESLNQQAQPQPSAPPPEPEPLEPESRTLTRDELRQIRLRRFT